MANVEGVHLERADLHGFAGFQSLEFDLFIVKAAAAKFGANHTKRERRAVNRRVHALEQMPDCAGVVFVTMGDHNSAHFVRALLNVFKVRDDVINPDHVVVGEHHTGVHHEDFTAVFVDGHILPDLPQASQGNNA